MPDNVGEGGRDPGSHAGDRQRCAGADRVHGHGRMTGKLSISVAALSVLTLCAQTAKKPGPVQTQATSTIGTTTDSYGAQIVEIHNVSYEVTGTNVPGRARDDRLLLRKTIHSKETLGDIGVEASITLEAWRFGDDLKQKPLYALAVSGTEGHTLDNAIFLVSRGLDETEWWSIYRLGSGRRLFDTYVPLVSFSISRETVTTRYAGLDVPGDDVKDARLKQPNVVAVLTYASEERLIREALLTCDDPKLAAQLRSFADESRTLSLVEGPASKAAPREPSRTLKLSFRDEYPAAPLSPLDVLIPLEGDDLDLARAQLPAKMHVTAWRR